MERISEELDPLGVMVVMEAEHMCMTIRGVQSPGTTTTTSAVCGVFADHDRTAKDEFLRLIGR
jgi:GTP cyclohydrolase I